MGDIDATLDQQRVFNLNGIALPNELCFAIVNQLDAVEEILTLRQVSKQMRAVVDGCAHTRSVMSRSFNRHPETLLPSISDVEWMVGMGFEVPWSQLLLSAIHNGLLECLVYLYQHAPVSSLPKYPLNLAAEMGHLEVIKWLDADRKKGCTTTAMDFAAANGHLKVVKWLHDNRTEGCTTFAMDWAAADGHLEVVKWLHANRTEGCTTDAMDRAAGNGHLEVVQWLHANRTEGCTRGAMDWAARNGHLKVVQWLHANRTEGCTTDAIDWAVANGNLELVKWLASPQGTEGLGAKRTRTLKNQKK